MIQVTGTNKLKEREEAGKVEGDTDRGTQHQQCTVLTPQHSIHNAHIMGKYIHSQILPLSC